MKKILKQVACIECFDGFFFGNNIRSTVKLGIKELLNKEQTGFKELFTDYQPFYTKNLLLNKELFSIQEMPKLYISEHEIVKISKKRGL